MMHFHDTFRYICTGNLHDSTNAVTSKRASMHQATAASAAVPKSCSTRLSDPVHHLEHEKRQNNQQDAMQIQAGGRWAEQKRPTRLEKSGD